MQCGVRLEGKKMEEATKRVRKKLTTNNFLAKKCENLVHDSQEN